MNAKKNEAWKHAPKSAATKAKISAAMRGNANRNGKTKAVKRVRLAISVSPETAAKLRAIKKAKKISAGRLVDSLIARVR